MVKKVLIAVAVLVAVLVVVIQMQPADYTVTRSATVVGAPQMAYDVVADFHQWDRWSPWSKMDPNQKVVHSGAPSGKGAVYEWSGEKTGAGRMTIVDAKPAELVDIKLEFTKPFESTSPTLFAFAPEGDGTKVTWTMKGTSNFMSKAVTLVAGPMDKMMGPQFDEGLANLGKVMEEEKAKAEKQAADEAAVAAAAAAAAAEALAAAAADAGTLDAGTK